MLLREACTDWQGSKNIFYNKKTQKISDNINDLIVVDDIEFNEEGLRNYLDYGYSVYGQTPIENICFLEPNTKVWIDEGNKLKFESLQDPFERVMGSKSSVKDTLEYFHHKMNEWIKGVDKQIIIPTSGGFDSRFINCMIEEKKRIHAYTYGVCEIQKESWEVVYAKKLCEILGIKWRQIELGDYNSLMSEWYRYFGAATHAHGMYHMEFYQKISHVESGGAVVSGLYGDLWSGNWEIPKITKVQDLIYLGLTHGLYVNSSVCKLKERHELRDKFFESNVDKLSDDNSDWRLILASRMKIILLSYLLRTPEWYGFEIWSPFLDFGVVSRMLNLSWDQKRKRKWQVEYFKQKNLLVGKLNLPCDRTNDLDAYSCLRVKPKPLDVKLLGRIIKETFIEDINRNITGMTKDKIRYYNAYLVLYPLEKLLRLKEYGDIDA